MTLRLQGMNVSMGDLANAFQPKGMDTLRAAQAMAPSTAAPRLPPQPPAPPATQHIHQRTCQRCGQLPVPRATHPTKSPQPQRVQNLA